MTKKSLMKKVGRILTNVFLILCCGISSSFATTYYVKPTGNDSNNGTSEATAWMTIAKACRTLVAGDTVLIRAGNYNEAADQSDGNCGGGEPACGPLVPRNSGTAGKFIVYKGYPGERPTIKGNLGGNYARYAANLFEKSYIILDSLIVTNSYRGITVNFCDHIIVKNCKVFDTRGPNNDNNGGVFFSYEGGCKTCVVDACTLSNNFLSGSSNWNASGLHIYNSKNCTLSNNIIYDQDGFGIRLKWHDTTCVVKNNIIYDCGEGIGIGEDGPRNEIYENIIYNGTNSGAGEGDGILIINDYGDNDSTRVYNNVIYNCDGAGIKLQGYSNQHRNFKSWNNIIMACRGTGGFDEFAVEVPSQWTNRYSDYNCFYDNGDNTIITWGTTERTLVQHQSATNLDSHSVQQNPLFIDPPTSAYDAVYDFHLQSGSPAKSTGKGGVDMGAYPRPDTGASPHISLSPQNLTFNAVQNGPLPSSQTFTITNSGVGTLNWSMSDNATWLGESPTSGNNNSVTITVSVNTTNLSPGTYNAAITISSSNADNSPQVVSVAYIIASQTLTPPVPISPPDGSTIEDTSATLIIRNGTDSLGSMLLHSFQIDSAVSFDSPRLKQSSDLALNHPDDTTTEWPVQGLTRGRIYYWRAFAYTNTSPPYYSAPSSISNFRIRQQGVAKAIVDIHVYPNAFNPSLNHSYVTFHNIPLNSTIKITTLSGELVKTFENTQENEVVWDVKNEDQRNLASGVYFYWVNHPGVVASGKIVVIR